MSRYNPSILTKVSNWIGSLAGLKTAAKGSVVAAINEQDDKLGNLSNSIEINAKYPPAPLVGAKGDGVTDDTTAINNIINFVNSNVDSTFNGSYRGGVVRVPSGVYLVSSIIQKSGVKIKGAGMFSTRFKPSGTSGFVFDLQGVNHTNRISHAGIEDIGISPTGNWWGQDGTVPNVSGINMQYSVNMYMKNVMIDNIGGTGIDTTECYDSYFENVWLWHVGTNSTNPALLLNSGTADLTNACTFEKFHVEQCPVSLVIKGAARQNQFIGCKFEWGLAGVTPTEANIQLQSTIGTSFTGCMFVSDKLTQPLIRADFAVGDVFTGCTFSAPSTGTGWFIDTTSNCWGVSITGCSFPEYGTAIAVSGYNFSFIANSCFRSGANGYNFINAKGGCIVEGNLFLNSQILWTSLVVQSGTNLIRNNNRNGTFFTNTTKMRNSTTGTPMGVNNVDGAVTFINPRSGYNVIVPIQIGLTAGGSFVDGTEIVSVKIQSNLSDGSQYSLSKTFTGAPGTIWLSQSDLNVLLKDGLDVNSFAIWAHTNKATTSTSASVQVIGFDA